MPPHGRDAGALPTPKGALMSSMPCPSCQSKETRVVSTRPADGGVRRIRVCEHCAARFSSFEAVVKSRSRKAILQKDPAIDKMPAQQVSLFQDMLIKTIKEVVQATVDAALTKDRNVRVAQKKRSEARRQNVAKKPPDPLRIPIPDWVPPLYQLTYRQIAARDGEHAAASHVRKLKNAARRQINAL
jgi:transcriptional regulator NrdR family protein